MSKRVRNSETESESGVQCITGVSYLCLCCSDLMAEVDYVILDEWYRWIVDHHPCQVDQIGTFSICFSIIIIIIIIMPHPHRAEALSDDVRLTSVCRIRRA